MREDQNTGSRSK